MFDESFVEGRGLKSNWQGYERYDFHVAGREALVVSPKVASPGRPWVWRAEFFNAFAQVDMALLEKGWHLAYFCVSNMYGCPEAIDLMHGFQADVETRFDLAKQAVLFGFSRGGLYAFNYTAKYPEKVSKLYLDAPVLDIRTWPRGKEFGEGEQKEYEECLKIYSLNEETIKDFSENPLDKVDQVAKAHIPIILVAGDADTIVSFERNGAILAKHYRELGEEIEMIVKPGVGHHPHSLEDPAPVVDFLLRTRKEI